MPRQPATQVAPNAGEERYRLLFDRVPVGLYRTTLDGRILEANPALVQILSYPDRLSLLRVPVADLYVDPADREAEASLLDREGVVRGYEMRLLRHDGSTVWVRDTCRAVYDHERRQMNYEGILEDITERKQAEEQLMRTNRQLATSILELQQHDQAMTHLNRLHTMLQTCLTPDEAYTVIGVSIPVLLAGHAGSLAVLRPGAPALETVARWGDAAVPKDVFMPDACWALRQGQMHALADPRAGPLCRHFAKPPEAGYACLPLMVQNETLGLLSVCQEPGGELGSLHLVVSVAEAIKLSLSNLRLREALREQATHDALTGLHNRRYLDETLAYELQRADRLGGNVSVAMLDIDHFKQFNDIYGHDAGDAVLRELASLLRASLRRSDIACRFGGEEFVVVLPGAAADEVRARLDRFRRRVSEVTIRHAGQTLGTVTVSIGVAQAPKPGDAAELLRLADEALYAAKQAGRDCIALNQAAA
jgi:diguanylate cyclase (GGDEF)-like protein/PAS domain S-box-containing protein